MFGDGHSPIFGSMNLFVMIELGLTLGSAVLTLPKVLWKSLIIFCTRAGTSLPRVLSGPLLTILSPSILALPKARPRIDRVQNDFILVTTSTITLFVAIGCLR